MRVKLSFLVLCLLAGCGVPKPATVEGKNLRPINPGYPDHYVERTLAGAQQPVAVKRSLPVEVAPAASSPVAVNVEPAIAPARPAAPAVVTAAVPVAAVSVSPAPPAPATPPSEPAAAPDYSSPLFAMPTGNK